MLPLSLAAMIGLCCEAAGQTIDGVLLERGTERPVELALITLLGADGDSIDAVLTDAEGRFQVASAEAGEFQLSASALGYGPAVATRVFAIPQEVSIFVEFRIEPSALEIGGFTIEVPASVIREPDLIANGFLERYQQGFGRFITPADIERSTDVKLSDLLARTGRVTTRYRFWGDQVVMLGTAGYCTPILFVDAVRVEISRGMTLDALVPLEAVRAAEVYRSAAQAPLRFGGLSSNCGVIALWTKKR